jgi:thiol-disulfide isomerase/thioredoxin
MKRNVLLSALYFALSIIQLNAQQKAEIVTFEDFERRVEASDKPVTIVNFWATWCAPCIKELPYFEEAFQSDPEHIDLVLVNLDFADKVEKVNAFLEKKSIKGDVLLLDNIDYNSWIDRVEPSWSGAIPATLFISHHSGKRKFVEGELSKSDLKNHIEEMIN